MGRKRKRKRSKVQRKASKDVLKAPEVPGDKFEEPDPPIGRFATTRDATNKKRRDQKRDRFGRWA